MVRITVELVPMGDETKKKTIGTAKIALKRLSSSSNVGEYRAEFRGKKNRPLGEVKVTGFPRKRLGAWDLILRSLVEKYGARNGVLKNG